MRPRNLPSQDSPENSSEGPIQDGPIKSPCVRVCVLAKDSGLCRGCWRTMEEIVRWPSFDNATRATIMAALPARRDAATKGRRKGLRRREEPPA